MIVKVVQPALVGSLQHDARPLSNSLQALEILDVGVGHGCAGRAGDRTGVWVAVGVEGVEVGLAGEAVRVVVSTKTEMFLLHQ